MSVIPTPAQAAAPVETPTTEAPATTTAPAVEAPKEKDAFAEKLELLSRKERQVWKERQRIQQMEQQLQSEKAEYEKFKALKAKAKQSPLDFLSEAGLSYDELTQYVLNGGKPTEKDEFQSLRSEFEKLRQEREDEKKRIQEQQTQAQRQAETEAIEGFKSQIAEFVEQNKSTYELSAQRDATEDIFTTISDAFTIQLNEWNRTGRRGPKPSPMDIKSAADIVEDFYEKEVLRLAETSKLKSKLGIQPKEEAQPTKQPSKTLTNNMASTAASVVPAKTDNDRMRRALEKLGG